MKDQHIDREIGPLVADKPLIYRSIIKNIEDGDRHGVAGSRISGSNKNNVRLILQNLRGGNVIAVWSALIVREKCRDDCLSA